MSSKAKPILIPSMIARVVYYHFFGADHPFPGVGYNPESDCPTYAGGCAVGCLVDRAARKSLDDFRPPNGDNYQTVVTIFEHHRPLLESALSSVFFITPSGLSLDIVSTLHTLQCVHDRHAKAIFYAEDEEAKAQAIEAFRYQLLAACLIFDESTELAFPRAVDRLPEQFELPSWIGQPSDPWSVTA